ncbi:MFS general substrate transporter [Dichomitus squalens LYAD-421 SS1]|uniref:MFS general substrate transporter n=1 Tax=Dichomitus squalens (strain LYAD-421) TaxID=732165 RepID=R7SRI0_DICSQ|nr:MFS general substrate transporter [Dichomitus squalens LYAD-421 SS1]EJF57577.1 MFS general substrate transporter [Dichomitus squalens LYAD-421 SS1]
MSLEEKKDVEVEQLSNRRASTESLPDGELLAADVRPAAERRLVRALDMRLLPTIILVFIMNYIDRVAVTAARLKGLEQDLGLNDIQYATVLAVLYASYVPAQIPSNMILNRISRPSWYIPTCVVLWGMTSALTGVAKNYAGILAARIFVGVPEAAFYPGAIYLLSRWYTRRELAFRSALLYGGLLISNAFGSLMAAGILSGMEGKLGIRAWRWLFYIEGAITIFIGFCAVFTLPDYPHNTRWLNPAQRRLAQVRLAEDAGEADEDGSTESAFAGLILALKDPKVPIFAVMTCAQLLGLGFVNFFPTIAGTLGFNTTVTLVLAAPPWILATIVCCLTAWNADRTGERFFHICVPWWGVIVGYIIGVSTFSIGGRYVAMFLMACGYAGFALTLVWVSNAIPRPPAKRSAAIGIVNGFGNLGNLISSYVWKPSWGPDYHPPMIIGIAALALATALAIVIRQILVSQNKRLDCEELDMQKGARRERIEEAARLEGITYEEALQRKKTFRYLL